jgi:ketosteroid isomerase-like protein
LHLKKRSPAGEPAEAPAIRADEPESLAIAGTVSHFSAEAARIKLETEERRAERAREAATARVLAERLGLRYPRTRRVLSATAMRIPRSRLKRRLMRRVFRWSNEALSRGDLESAFATLSPDVEYNLSHQFPEAGLLHGRDALIEFWETNFEDWTEIRVEQLELVELDDQQVLDTGVVRGRGRTSGIEVSFEYTRLLKLEHGLVVRVDNYVDKGQALAAVLGGADELDDEPDEQRVA